MPVGIVFTNDGSTALEAFQFFSPDSTGNSGALVAFDAVNRKVTSTLLLKNGPSALVMAPDGLTAYLLSNNGQITYYDVLSGTADLSVSTFTPGLAGGYPGSSANVFAHPDGTRLFWNVNTLLVAFDLNTHKIAYRTQLGPAHHVSRVDADGAGWFHHLADECSGDGRCLRCCGRELSSGRSLPTRLPLYIRDRATDVAIS